MTSKTSSSNSVKEFRKIYFWTLKSNKGLAILYTVLCFIALPGIMLLEISASGIRVINDNHIYLMLVYVVTPLMMLFALIVSLNAFNFMHKKRPVDLFHSLPVKRTSLFLGKFCAVVTLLIVPLLLNFGIALLIDPLSLYTASEASLILQRMLWILLFSIIIPTFCAFFAVSCGTILDTIVSVGVVSIFYPLTIALGIIVVGQMLPGFNFNGSLHSTYITALSPLVAILIPTTGTPDNAFLIWWLCLTAVLLIGSILVYRRRKSESAESSFTFPIPVFIRFIGSFGTALGVGFIFISSFNNSNTSNNLYFWIGAIIGSLLAHFIIEAVYSRGFKKLKRSLLYYAVFAVVFVGAYVSVSTGFFGYDTYIPNADKVASVSVDSIILDTSNSAHNNAVLVPSSLSGNGTTQSCYYNTTPPMMREATTINAVEELHQYFIDNYRKNESYPYQIRKTDNDHYIYPVRINYYLKDGSMISRSYNVSSSDSQSKNLEVLNNFANIEEFKKASQLIFSLPVKDINSISFSNSNPFYGNNYDANSTKSLNNLSNSLKQELIEALQEDVLAETAEQRKSTNYQSSGLYLMLQPYIVNESNVTDRVYFTNQAYCIPDYFVNTRAVIDKYGWLK